MALSSPLMALSYGPEFTSYQGRAEGGSPSTKLRGPGPRGAWAGLLKGGKDRKRKGKEKRKKEEKEKGKRKK